MAGLFDFLTVFAVLLRANLTWTAWQVHSEVILKHASKTILRYGRNQAQRVTALLCLRLPKQTGVNGELDDSKMREENFELCCMLHDYWHETVCGE